VLDALAKTKCCLDDGLPTIERPDIPVGIRPDHDADWRATVPCHLLDCIVKCKPVSTLGCICASLRGKHHDQAELFVDLALDMLCSGFCRLLPFNIQDGQAGYFAGKHLA